MGQDKIYAGRESDDEPFRFNEAVTRVFPDMLQRSIPGYAASIEAIGSLAARYVRPRTTCYDLGCSLGAATLAMRQGIAVDGCHIVAVDNAPAMVERCRQVMDENDARGRSETSVEVVHGDIREVAIANASMVVLNYTLQFLELADRDAVIQKILDGLIGGGVLVLSEKVVDDDPRVEELLVDLHREHKRRNNYSALEISRKRTALEKVLIPESVTAHRERLAKAGFRHSAVWLRYFNFVSIVAIR